MFRSSCWRCGSKMSYVSCVQVVAIDKTMSLQYINSMNCTMIIDEGEKPHGGLMGDLPLMHEMYTPLH